MAKDISIPSASCQLRPQRLFEKVWSRAELWLQFLWGCFWIGITLFGAFLTPASALHGTHEELGLPPCPSVILFNRPCPGCGLTTSFTALLHGDFRMAFHAHPFGPILYLMLAVTGIASFYGFFTKQKLNIAIRPSQIFLTAFMIVFLSFGIYRFATTPNYQTPVEHQFRLSLRP